MNYTRYYHTPLVPGADADHIVEFCHIVRDGQKGCFNPLHEISLRQCKINVFMKGDFSVIVGEKVYVPRWGDLCFLVPFESHHGQVPHDTFLDYYQLDVGMQAFDALPGGERLLSLLCDREKNKKVFARPDKASADLILQTCAGIESALDDANPALAFAETVRCLSQMERAFRHSAQPEPTVLTPHTARVLRIIDECPGENLSIDELARQCSVSPSWLSRTFRQEIGETIHGYMMTQRLKYSVGLLADHSVAEVSCLCGFADSSHYIAQFRRHFGMTPFAYRQSGGRDRDGK